MKPLAKFDLQGHRGARGLKPENTLPSFEAAFDVGVSTVETDVHLTADGVPVLYHDDKVSELLCRLMPHPQDIEEEWISSLTLAELRCFLADRNPDPRRFPDQDAEIPPLSALFAEQTGIPAYAIPTLADLFAFSQAYAGKMGKQAGKTPQQQEKAARIRFDLELKRVPFFPEVIGDTFVGEEPGLLEIKVMEAVRKWKVTARTCVRSFDHRAVRAIKKKARGLAGAVLIAETAPVAPAQLARQARADTYAPDYRFVDPQLIAHTHAHGIRVVPWTVNEPRDWERLIAWGVDGLTTDYPDRLGDLLRKHHIETL